MNTPANLHQHISQSLKAVFFVSLFSLTFNGFSQGSIQGTVRHAETGETLPGAHAVIKIGKNIIADATDLDGDFWIKPLEAGQYDICISYLGFDTARIENVQVTSNKITRLKDIMIAPIASDLPPVTIKWEPPVIDIDGGTKFTMDTKTYQEMPNKLDIKSTLTAVSTDLSMDQSTRKIHFRGSRADDFIYIIDGIKQRGGEVHIPSGAIKSITIYSGGIPAQYGDFTGGVIVIETLGYFDWLARQDD
ncbi:MAG: carboxypeptidase regulatory-like domain-containing protein [Bacteroidota bacterium]